MGRNKLKLKGEKFSRLLALEEIGTDKWGNKHWRCLCDCGNETIVRSAYLNSGQTRSCGCITIDRLILPKGIAARNQILSRYKLAALQRGIIWSISDKKFLKLLKQDCYYCGYYPNQISRGKRYNGDYVYNGIDRVNPDKNIGYSEDNCVPCCRHCNTSKSNYTKDEFLLNTAFRFLHKFILDEDFRNKLVKIIKPAYLSLMRILWKKQRLEVIENSEFSIVGLEENNEVKDERK